MARVTFLPQGVTVEVGPDESPFAAARNQGILVPTACNGKGTCGLCRVKIVSGGEHLDPPSPVETRHLGNTYFITKLRLSCQIRPRGDLTVLLPDAPKRPG